jgi:hypothetical protein
MSRIVCHDRFDEHALHRWEAEGGCLGVMPQRGRDGPCSQTQPKGIPQVSFDEPRVENFVRSARGGQYRHAAAPSA